MVSKVKSIEKRSFPRSEALDFDAELKKCNTTLLVATLNRESREKLGGYCVFARVRRDVLLHKICVEEDVRRQGIAYAMIQHVRQTVGQKSDKIILWVDEARLPARKLYERCGFAELETCLDYYGPGRHGLKMILKLAT
ncbi:acyl-CoA N-acyltransferase [Rhizodiscina lignyota]|uniref:Acyl-CoA N-acyltransferase n=1 Tax=Rhizodiscina lignyota TaxID=1504668 RepID=A0A9P4I382_9PEZI|nr:acyl-CoA N-acyltransferase [Rhizodiscina lignyota]